MVPIDHNGQEPAGPMAITLGYQVKSVERHRFHMSVISDERRQSMARHWASCPRPHDGTHPRDYLRLGYYRQAAPSAVSRALGDVAGDAPSFIEGQHLGNSCVVRIGVAVDRGKALTVRSPRS